MPRGVEIARPILVGRVAVPPGLPEAEGVRTSAIEAVVDDFAKAWFEGDAQGLAQSLHPGYAGHLVKAVGEPMAPSMESVTRVLGVQASLGPLTPPHRRRREVKVLDLRQGAASILAILGDWMAYLHLTRSGDRWAIVNVLWSWQPQA
jgi:hypothetical protein